MSIPVTIVREKNMKLPSSPLQYLIGSNGVHMNVTNKWISATIPVANGVKEGWDFKPCDIAGLAPVKTEATWLLPAIPYEIMAQIVGFFSEIERRMGTEVAVLLHHSEEQGWAITVPSQEVTGGTVSYEADQRLPGYRCVGTMHSHVRMGAFHSGVDVPDEAQFDGLHCTIGHVHKYPNFDMDAEIVFRGTRFKAPVSKVFRGLRGNAQGYKLAGEPVAIPEEWFENVKEKKWSYGGTFNWAKHYRDKWRREDNDDDDGKGFLPGW